MVGRFGGFRFVDACATRKPGRGLFPSEPDDSRRSSLLRPREAGKLCLGRSVPQVNSSHEVSQPSRRSACPLYAHVATLRSKSEGNSHQVGNSQRVARKRSAASLAVSHHFASGDGKRPLAASKSSRTWRKASSATAT